MNAIPVMFLMVYFCKSFALNGYDMTLYRGFERRHDISRLIFNVPGGEVRSVLRCGDLCARSSSCKAFCYSQSTALCYLSQPYDPIVQKYNGSDFECYISTGCPMTKGYAWYGARCIKGYAEKMEYTVARAICTQDGGHLYHFKDLEWDLQPIEDLHNAAGYLADDGLWMGADDLEVQGQYKWSDSSLLADDSPVWSPGQPDTPNHRCVLGMLPSTFWLYDGSCDWANKFVCQIDV